MSLLGGGRGREQKEPGAQGEGKAADGGAFRRTLVRVRRILREAGQKSYWGNGQQSVGSVRIPSQSISDSSAWMQ